MLSAIVVLLVGLKVAVPLVGQAPSAAPPDPTDQGTFEIFASGQSIGIEKFEIRLRSGRIEAQSEVRMNMPEDGKSVESRTTSSLVLDPQLDPLSYTWNQKGAQTSQLSIDFHSKPVHARRKAANGQEDRRDLKLDKDVIVLDDNVIHHYQLALARYNKIQGGTQVFRAFIPQEALPGVITLNEVGPETVTVDGTKRTLRRFLLTTDSTQISLWADDQGHLQFMSAADNQYQATRKK
ncbi:MAG: hypothetical protein P4N24_11015 [Acidobacteriota bacterium]|nr:hypothetical protein [Acidobacteriota bacterium]